VHIIKVVFAIVVAVAVWLKSFDAAKAVLAAHSVLLLLRIFLLLRIVCSEARQGGSSTTHCRTETHGTSYLAPPRSRRHLFAHMFELALLHLFLALIFLLRFRLEHGAELLVVLLGGYINLLKELVHAFTCHGRHCDGGDVAVEFIKHQPHRR